MSLEDPRSDDALIDAMGRVGDTAEKAFAALYHRHKAWAVAVARRYTHDDALALDAMQDAFLYVIGKTPGLRLTCKFRTFLYPAVKNAAMTRVKRSRRQAVNEVAPHLVESPLQTLLDAGLRERIARVIADLTDAQREVLIMRIVDDMTVDEVARALGIPPGTVKSRLHHALAAMREVLSGEAAER